MLVMTFPYETLIFILNKWIFKNKRNCNQIIGLHLISSASQYSIIRKTKFKWNFYVNKDSGKWFQLFSEFGSMFLAQDKYSPLTSCNNNIFCFNSFSFNGAFVWLGVIVTDFCFLSVVCCNDKRYVFACAVYTLYSYSD